MLSFANVLLTSFSVGLRFVEIYIIVSLLLLEVGRNRCVNSTFLVIVARIFGVRMAGGTGVSGLWGLVS